MKHFFKIIFSSFFFCGMVFAQDFPNRAIRIIVPFTPGGGTDVITRLMAEKMSSDLGVSVVVENKPGASGIIGADFVAKANPDGYTLLMTNSALAINPSLFKLPFDTQKFTPITKIASAPQLLVATTTAPFKNLKDMLTYAKANPEKVSIGTAGAGQLSHLAGELLGKMSDTKYTMVHYKGSANGVADLISGQITMSFGTAPSLIPHIKNGKMVPIAVSSATRIQALPQVPTVAELIPGYDLSNWFGIFAPGQTTKPVVDKLFLSISKALASPDISSRLMQDGFDSIGLPPDRFDKSFREELAFWQKFVKDNNIKIE